MQVQGLKKFEHPKYIPSLAKEHFFPLPKLSAGPGECLRSELFRPIHSCGRTRIGKDLRIPSFAAEATLSPTEAYKATDREMEEIANPASFPLPSENCAKLFSIPVIRHLPTCDTVKCRYAL